MPGAEDRSVADDIVRFPTRIALVMRDDLAPWQTVNVAAFLASGVAADPTLVGDPYADADGTEYLPMLGQPVMVMQGDLETLQGVRAKAVAREIRVAVYAAGMFSTGHDAANREVVAASAGADLDLVGVAIHGPKNVVDRILKGVPRHR
jgi:hypothetical protein